MSPLARKVVEPKASSWDRLWPKISNEAKLRTTGKMTGTILPMRPSSQWATPRIRKRKRVGAADRLGVLGERTYSANNQQSNQIKLFQYSQYKY